MVDRMSVRTSDWISDGSVSKGTARDSGASKNFSHHGTRPVDFWFPDEWENTKGSGIWSARRHHLLSWLWISSLEKTHRWTYVCASSVLLFAWHIPSLLQNCLAEHSSRHRLVAYQSWKCKIMSRDSSHISPGRSSWILWRTVDKKASHLHRNNLRLTSRRLEKWANCEYSEEPLRNHNSGIGNIRINSVSISDSIISSTFC